MLCYSSANVFAWEGALLARRRKREVSGWDRETHFLVFLEVEGSLVKYGGN